MFVFKERKVHMCHALKKAAMIVSGREGGRESVIPSVNSSVVIDA